MHQVGAQVQHQRRLRVPGVGVTARAIRPPRQDPSPLAFERGHSAVDGVAVPAVTVDEHDAGRPVGRADELDHDRHQRRGADRQRAREAGVLAAGPERWTATEGGYPIIVDGECIGGIGVSGGTWEFDDRVARSALEAIGAGYKIDDK